MFYRKLISGFCISLLLSNAIVPQSFANEAAIEQRISLESLQQSSRLANIILDPENDVATAFGADIYFLDSDDQDEKVSITIKCLDESQTPSLAVSPEYHGTAAQLHNVTSTSSENCASLDILIAQAAGGDGRVTIGLPQTPQANEIPSSSDPAVFTFNPVTGNWAKAKEYNPQQAEANKSYATLTERWSKVITGVIVEPDALANEPMLNSAKTPTQALGSPDPYAAYLSVDDIAPNPSGTASFELPLMLRSPQNPGPRFKINYSSDRGIGVLGKGWDLIIDTIEVDTRRGAPLYHQDFETEDYAFNGMDMIALDANGRDLPPLHKGGPILRRVKGERFFRLRDNSQGLVIRRRGAAPEQYSWEIWDPNTHTTRLFAARSESVFGAPKPTENGRLRSGSWGLTHEYDNQFKRRGTLYTYAQSNCDESWGDGASDCMHALRLSRIKYNATVAEQDQGAAVGETEIVFAWDKRESARFTSDGRLGFLRVNEHWLSSITVLYDDPATSDDTPRSVSLTDDLDEESGWRVKAGEIGYTTHKFRLSGDGSDKNRDPAFDSSRMTSIGAAFACMDFERTLKRYSIEANEHYDAATSALEDQTFEFGYHAESRENCDRWASANTIKIDDIFSENTLEGAFEAAIVNQDPDILAPLSLISTIGFNLLTQPSFLGANQSEELGGSLYAGFGPDPNIALKPISGGVKGGFNFSESIGLTALADVTGDGIDDVIYRAGGNLRYCRGTRNPKTRVIEYPPSHSECRPILGVDTFLETSSSNRSIGVEAHFPVSSFAGAGLTNSENDTYVYFTHADGDGLIDIVQYGRILYGQGERVNANGQSFVSFEPRSALVPPVPDGISDETIAAHRPEGLTDAVRKIGDKLAAASETLSGLRGSQKTVAWEAPLSGLVTVSGSLEIAVALDGFDRTRERVDQLRPYLARPEINVTEIDFVPEIIPTAQISRSDRGTDTVTACTEVISVPDGILRFEEKDIDAVCQSRRVGSFPPLNATEIDEVLQSEDDQFISVNAGDVVYITYTLDGDIRSEAKIDAKIEYLLVEDDWLFNHRKARAATDREAASGALPCNFGDLPDSASSLVSNDCLLGKTRRYSFDLDEAFLVTTSDVAVDIPQGSNRSISGQFEFPMNLAKDYLAEFEILGVPADRAVNEALMPDNFERVGVHNISLTCNDFTDKFCTVRLDVNSSCVGAPSFAGATVCPEGAQSFFDTDSPQFKLFGRLNLRHKSGEAIMSPVDARLAEMRWLEPLLVSSVPTEERKLGDDSKPVSGLGEKAAIQGPINTYLPVVAGVYDRTHFRLIRGSFDDTENLGSFQEVLNVENETVELARKRQVHSLCMFARELKNHAAAELWDIATEWAYAYWEHEERCDAVQTEIDDLKIDGLSPGYLGKSADRLELLRLLGNLSHDDRIFTAETMYHEVLDGLDIIEEALIDAPNVTRRGYRMPFKANPLPCSVIAPKIEPLDAPILERPTDDCAFRLNANFAMEELGAQLPTNFKFDGISTEGEDAVAAFEIRLRAEVNGKPLDFRELTHPKANPNPALGESRCSRDLTTCVGQYSFFNHDPYPKPWSVTEDDANFSLRRLNQRTARATAFSDAVLRTGDKNCLTDKGGQLNKIGLVSAPNREAKQDHCVALDDSDKFVGAPVDEIILKIDDSNRFIGRERVFEFRARPLDLVTFDVEILPLENRVERGGRAVVGHFSTASSSSGETYLIPRSPRVLLENARGEVATTIDCAITAGGINAACRPFSRLGATELLLGAQYRTFSDVQFRRDVPASLLVRRELLRLNPEIAVASKQLALDGPSTSALTVDEALAEGQGPQGVLGAALGTLTDATEGKKFDRSVPVSPKTPDVVAVFRSRAPAIAKTGRYWSLFGGSLDGQGEEAPILRLPPDYEDLRFPETPTSSIPSMGDLQQELGNILGACGGEDDDDKCETQAESLNDRPNPAQTLGGVDFFGLFHRFVGPVSDLERGVVDNDEEGQCTRDFRTSGASCWLGADDTVLYERAVQLNTPEEGPFSVAGLLGIERPIIRRYERQLEIVLRIACQDPVFVVENVSSCEQINDTIEPVSFEVSRTEDAAYPNRPAPPERDRSLPVFAPLPESKSRTISVNAGVAFVNASFMRTRKDTRELYIDVNGDGFPERVRDGSATLTSPVGLPRVDWWKYFRHSSLPEEVHKSKLVSDSLRADGFTQTSRMRASGIGIGLSPETAALFREQGTGTISTGSPDAGLNPSFDLSWESGQQTRFTDLKDFNGDGLVERISGQTVDDPLCVALNTGNGLRKKRKEEEDGGCGKKTEINEREILLNANGAEDSGHLFAKPFNTNHSSGFAVRLGFSIEGGSISGGMGIAHRDSQSEGMFADFNGDGRIDLILPLADKGRLLVFPNLGNGFGAFRIHEIPGWKGSETSAIESTIVDAGGSFTTGFPIFTTKVIFSPATKTAAAYERELLQLRDLNADGHLDLASVAGVFKSSVDAFGIPDLLLDGDAKARIRYNPDAQNQLLTEIRNPAGASIRLGYSLLGNAGPEHGRHIWALTQVEHDDGFEPLVALGSDTTLPADGDDVQRTDISYGNGYYNRAERRFYGFAGINTTLSGCDRAGGDCVFEALRRSDQQYANRDYLTKGRVLETKLIEPEGSVLLSHDRQSYSIDNLIVSATATSAGECDRGLCNGVSWTNDDFDGDASSALPEPWRHSRADTSDPDALFGGLCIDTVLACAEALTDARLRDGFEREQRTFWAQQSGSVRGRLQALDVFGDAGEEGARLQSAIATDHDRWGQIRRFTELGEVPNDPVTDASNDRTLSAYIDYADRQGLEAAASQGAEPGTNDGYPMLNLAARISIREGIRHDDKLLRMREAVYPNDGRGLLSDICKFPDLQGINAANLPDPGIACEDYANTLSAGLDDERGDFSSALESTYDELSWLRRPNSGFNSVIHSQITGYDDYGNILVGITPHSMNYNWMERRFSYDADPFRRTPTKLHLTRCVSPDAAGAGADSHHLLEDDKSECTFGLSSSNVFSSDQVRSVTHAARTWIDAHHGSVAAKQDINDHHMLLGHDRWGRLDLVARTWSDPTQYDADFESRISRAAYHAGRPDRDWYLLGLVDYPATSNGALQASIRRFETAGAYRGISGAHGHANIVETTGFADGSGRAIQSIFEAEVCVAAHGDVIDDGDASASGSFADHCTQTAEAIVTPAPARDALGRDIATYEPYAPPASDSFGSGVQTPRFESLIEPEDGRWWLTITSYDAANRPQRIDSRLQNIAPSEIIDGAVLAAMQFAYRIRPGNDFRGSRFEALTMSPRCTATAIWSDARGLTTDTFEDQANFYTEHPSQQIEAALPSTSSPGYTREYDFGRCQPVAELGEAFATETSPPPMRLSYRYDALRQLERVQYGDAEFPYAIDVEHDDLGRMVSIRERNTGHTRQAFDNLHNLIAETTEALDPEAEERANVKRYTYAADRLLEIEYQAFDGRKRDDAVTFYHDEYPHSMQPEGVIDPAPLVKNEKANIWLATEAGPTCINCTGRVTAISDATGARLYEFSPLGQPEREIRSIVGLTASDRAPELARYTLQNLHSEFGDLISQRFAEREPVNPAPECRESGADCYARFTLGTTFTPDGKPAILSLTDGTRPGALITAAYDALGRPAARWTGDGTVSAYRYDGIDLRLNQAATVTAPPLAGGVGSLPIQKIGYQYDAGGNVLSYANDARVDGYESAFAYSYDPANRLIGFNANAQKDGLNGSLAAAGRYAYDRAHRFEERELQINDWERTWNYRYGDDQTTPFHAPAEIEFNYSDESDPRQSALRYDSLGRMTGIRGDGEDPGVLSNRRMEWDAEGRLRKVIGKRDEAVPGNRDHIDEQYTYDYGGNRTVKIWRPIAEIEGESEELEHITLYMAPFYAKDWRDRGTVQLSFNNLPVASFRAPRPGAAPRNVTYLFNDLAVGSVSASILTLGTPGVRAPIIGRREFSPYGMELTSNALISSTEKGLGRPPSVFHGKELDLTTGFSSFGARYYSRDIGTWLSFDPAVHADILSNRLTDYSAYRFSTQNPISLTDTDGQRSVRRSPRPLRNAARHQRTQMQNRKVFNQARKSLRNEQLRQYRRSQNPKNTSRNELPQMKNSHGKALENTARLLRMTNKLKKFQEDISSLSINFDAFKSSEGVLIEVPMQIPFGGGFPVPSGAGYPIGRGNDPKAVFRKASAESSIKPYYKPEPGYIRGQNDYYWVTEFGEARYNLKELLPPK